VNLYLHCADGVSGDMLAAALCDLCCAAGLDGERIVAEALTATGIDETAARFSLVRRGGLAARSFHVDDRPGYAGFPDLEAAVARSSLSAAVQDRVAAAARRMAAAEATAHGDDHAELHELAGLDTIVDLVAVSALVEALAPDAVIASPPALGGGWIDGSHGRLAVPAPAVVAILRGVPTAGGDELQVGELTTPTGAALLTVLADRYGPWPAGSIVQSGVGAGSRETPGRANVLRAALIDAGVPVADDAAAVDHLLMLETSIDDLSAEYLADAAERLRAAGARDVWLTPVLMKKGRAAVTLHVLAEEAAEGRCVDLMFEHTSTFGVRRTRVDRLRLDERQETVTVEGRPVRVRLGLRRGRVLTASPEYEDCRRAGEALGLAPRSVFERAQGAARAAPDASAGSPEGPSGSE
jgi:hypothetical protein